MAAVRATLHQSAEGKPATSDEGAKIVDASVTSLIGDEGPLQRLASRQGHTTGSPR